MILTISMIHDINYTIAYILLCTQLLRIRPGWRGFGPPKRPASRPPSATCRAPSATWTPLGPLIWLPTATWTPFGPPNWSPSVTWSDLASLQACRTLKNKEKRYTIVKFRGSGCFALQALLDASWRRLWANLGPTWTLLGPTWGELGRS